MEKWDGKKKKVNPFSFPIDRHISLSLSLSLSRCISNSENPEEQEEGAVKVGGRERERERTLLLDIIYSILPDAIYSRHKQLIVYPDPKSYGWESSSSVSSNAYTPKDEHKKIGKIKGKIVCSQVNGPVSRTLGQSLLLQQQLRKCRDPCCTTVDVPERGSPPVCQCWSHGSIVKWLWK
ncbi:unnamed protein product [Acanthosepion pharaonis]|uniref:Uncharacterized protein n=1 Tax=Acanthosepion pharaonis TaxID=158019 RepID=A0A812BI39_ACAPH|nr:unnamed protein product [Sepia pharaonis]